MDTGFEKEIMKVTYNESNFYQKVTGAYKHSVRLLFMNESMKKSMERGLVLALFLYCSPNT